MQLVILRREKGAKPFVLKTLYSYGCSVHFFKLLMSYLGNAKQNILQKASQCDAF